MARSSSKKKITVHPESPVLPEQQKKKEADLLEKGEGEPKTPEYTEKASIRELFSFTDWTDKMLITVGVLCSLAQGTTLPLLTLVFGAIIDVFTDLMYGKINQDEFDRRIIMNVLYFCYIGIGSFCVSYGLISCFMWTAERQSIRIREAYFQAILRQNIGWFDVNTAGQLTTRISSDAQVVQNGIGEKLGLMIMNFTMFLAGFCLAFARGWKLALVLLSIIPVLGAAGGFLAKLLANATTKGQKEYGKAGFVVEEVLTAIRTVAAYSGELFELQRYNNALVHFNRESIKKARINGAGLGAVFGIMFSAYGLAFWYGSILISKNEMTPGEVLNTFFAMIIGAMSLGNMGPNMAAFFSARGAFAIIMTTIRRESPINSELESGRKLDKVEGKLEFRNIHFSYPNRSDVTVLNDFSLTVKPGQTVALVGSSGCGKSTTIQLSERFYDPISGQVLLDGVDLRDLNVSWFRSQISLVAQEPVLFSGSIFENIAFGKAGQNVTLEEVIEAAKLANAHHFIQKLPLQYDTKVGENGTLLSGGQRQRIAIARALLKNPKILLLDEATAALDSSSEKIVQAALDKASKSRTTLVVAHRLSTIQNADVIVVVDAGKIVEQGTHAELLEKKGKYYTLVAAQQLRSEEKKDEHMQEAVIDDDDVPPQPEEVKEKETEDKDKKIISTKAASVNEIEVKRTVPYKRIASLNRPEWPLFVVGVFGAALNGSIFPVFSIIYSQLLDSLMKPDVEEMLEGGRFWGGMFVALGGATALANFLQVSMFETAGIKLTSRIRNDCFKAILRQDIAFFDDDENNGIGALSSKLAREASLIQGIFGQLLGQLTQAFTAFCVGFGIAFYYGWELTLIVLCIIPIMAVASSLEMKELQGSNKYTKAYAKAGQIVSESVQAVRTVASLTAEKAFIKRYEEALQEPYRYNMKTVKISGVSFGVSQGCQFLAWAAAFYAGSRFVLNNSYSFLDMNIVLTAVIFTAMNLGEISTFMPDIAKARQAAIEIFDLIDIKPKIDSLNPDGVKLPDLKGKITLENVKFSYPRRPDINIMQDTSITIEPGQTVALVGESGCGKSTIIWLLERFYDPVDGNVMIDDVNIKDLNVAWLRRKIGLVTQEPKLFSGSIRDNIAYGKMTQKNDQWILDASEEEIIEAAKKANIHDFIEGLPDKYATKAGEKGSQLSGGQKQRIAIARALMRDPRILLLDEATSALDVTSEKLVQEALDKARVGRTTIIIAHRLSTVQNADRILVLAPGLNNEGGRIVEEGTHDELIAKQGLYFAYVQKQRLNTSS